LAEKERLAPIENLTIGCGNGLGLKILGQDEGLLDDQPLERSQAIEIGREHGCIILGYEPSEKTRLITASGVECQNPLAHPMGRAPEVIPENFRDGQVPGGYYSEGDK
jgi:hypothetical protein